MTATKRPPDRGWHTGELVVVVGASQSGKTYWTKQQVKAAARLIIWDREGQYLDCVDHVAHTRAELLALVRRNPRRLRVAFIPPRGTREELVDHFTFWCDCAFFLADTACVHTGGDYRAIPTHIVAEELAHVTNPGKAPAGWLELVSTGLKRHAWIYGVMQRPSECDKTIMGNCSQIHCHGVQRAVDRQYMAAEMDIPAAQIAALDRSRWEYIHKNMRTGKLETSRKTPRPAGKSGGNRG